MDLIESILKLLSGLSGIVVEAVSSGADFLNAFISGVGLVSTIIPSVVSIAIVCVIGIRIAMQLI